MTELRAPPASGIRSAIGTARNVAAAFRDLLDQEFSYSAGYLAAILNGCLFAPSVLTFWFVNGVVDFSTAIAIGAAGTAAGLQVRLAAYVLLVPTFLLTRVVAHLLHPGHRAEVLAGSCPSSRLLSLDWFSVGILATGLPLAMQDFGPWAGMNAVFLLGVFVLPRALPTVHRGRVRLAALVGGSTLFLYANYGGAVAVLPAPASVVGPVATVELSDAATSQFVTAVNSVVAGPVLVAGFGTVMNRVVTRPELADIPVVGHAMPRRDPDLVVVASAALGTAFYLGVRAAATGEFVVLPW
ncbi:hypothetical protein [Halobacterium rubrum]|uniref:hypothetical protein n=1 Tax=Halobacterium TaxID=2239 RepID=UPI001F2C32A5|nr:MULTISPECIES: hypothetical protein [Halobacterium]MDH5020320.1 hypothetical protein [Halobacterium rubrum]